MEEYRIKIVVECLWNGYENNLSDCSQNKGCLIFQEPIVSTPGQALHCWWAYLGLQCKPALEIVKDVNHGMLHICLNLGFVFICLLLFKSLTFRKIEKMFSSVLILRSYSISPSHSVFWMKSLCTWCHTIPLSQTL